MAAKTRMHKKNDMCISTARMHLEIERSQSVIGVDALLQKKPRENPIYTFKQGQPLIRSTPIGRDTVSNIRDPGCNPHISQT